MALKAPEVSAQAITKNLKVINPNATASCGCGESFAV